MRRLVSILCLLAATCLFTIGCGVKLFPDVHFAFKTTGGAGGYNENITEFVVGKRFYTAITVWLTTDTSWRSPEYRVVIEVPRTKEVEVEEHECNGSKPCLQVHTNGCRVKARSAASGRP